jgi:hypothetical protein
MNNPTVNVNTTQPAPWEAIGRKAASVEGIEWSAFVGLAIVDRAIRVLQLDPIEAWAALPERKRGRPVRYDPAKAPTVKRKRGRANG